MNDKRIQQVLELERQAYEVYNNALNEAALLPKEAEKDAQDLIEKTRKEAELEAQTIISGGPADDECAAILSQNEEKIRHTEALSANHFNRAVHYVLARVVGKE